MSRAVEVNKNSGKIYKIIEGKDHQIASIRFRLPSSSENLIALYQIMRLKSAERVCTVHILLQFVSPIAAKHFEKEKKRHAKSLPHSSLVLCM
jgi:hypothetical protein